MNITKIKKTKTKITLYFDKEKLEILPTTYASYNLYINKIIEEKELFEIKETNKINEYFSFVVEKLAICSYSPNKIDEFLKKKGANKEQIKKVLEKLRKLNFLNETKMVEDIISFCDSKHYGYYRILKILNDRKISQSEISKIEYNSRREENKANLLMQVLDSRYKNKNNFMRKKAVYSGLIRYGFEEQLSLELVNKLSNSNHMHEINVLKLDYDKCFLKYSRKYVGYELNQKIINSLLSKGYRINDINEVKENKK